MADKTQTISFRIRTIDTDLTEAIAKLSKDEIASKARDGMRLILGLTTSRVSQVIEQPIVPVRLKQAEQQTQTEQRAKLGNQGNPSVYRPKS